MTYTDINLASQAIQRNNSIIILWDAYRTFFCQGLRFGLKAQVVVLNKGLKHLLVA